MTDDPAPAAKNAGSAPDGEIWNFAGWGTSRRITDLSSPPRPEVATVHPPLLGVWRATAICGNDITSSVLYVSALCAAQAGALAPIVLLAVAGVLYLYRQVYAEVGSALPLNGGTYTVLLNTTNKRFAAAAACLTLLSYVATAVISASEAMHYAAYLIVGLPIMTATIAVLAFFAVLNLLGISESAVVALVIFVLHITTLALLSIVAATRVIDDPSLLAANWHLPEPKGVGHALLLGFAAAMLGISGFESSSNFIEEQAEGVFPKTLRNMWLAVAIFNPLTALLALGLVPLSVIRMVPADLLAQMGERAAGAWLSRLVSVDAVLVLAGAVLTSFVGVTGLVRRMTLDRCLPQVLLQRNQWRRTNHWIIIGFFALCASILVITHGLIGPLAGVYTLSFLSVMALFAIGNMLLKRTRARLPRATRASWPTVAVALCAVLTGLVTNILSAPETLGVFAAYFSITGVVVAAMLLRLELLALALFISRAVVDRTLAIHGWARQRILRKMTEINAIGVVYFTKGDDLAILNRAALYVQQNEQTSLMHVIHVYERDEEIPPGLAGQLATIDRLYPPLRIDFLAVRGAFGPDLIDALSQRLNVPKNLMFIGTPGDRFPHRIEELGGVRVIL